MAAVRTAFDVKCREIPAWHLGMPSSTSLLQKTQVQGLAMLLQERGQSDGGLERAVRPFSSLLGWAVVLCGALRQAHALSIVIAPWLLSAACMAMALLWPPCLSELSDSCLAPAGACACTD